MSSSGNLYDRVDGVESKVDDVSAKMDNLTAKIEGVLSVKQKTIKPRQTENPKITLKRFIDRAKKEYMWLGSRADFEKEKKTCFLFVWILIAVGLLATLFTSIAFKLYSTFTLFENIWLIMQVFIAKYIYKSKYYYDCVDFSKNSCFEFNLDGDGVLRVGDTKKKYKWFLVITCICAVCNIIVVWMNAEAGLAVIATIFELALGVLSVYVFHYRVIDYFCAYSDLRFTGVDDSNKKIIVLIYNPIINKLYTEEQHKKEFPFLYRGEN